MSCQHRHTKSHWIETLWGNFCRVWLVECQLCGHNRVKATLDDGTTLSSGWHACNKQHAGLKPPAR
jgi:hypothetical protein